MQKKILLLVSVGIAICTLSIVAVAQNQLAAVLEVLNAGVEMQRVNTANAIAIQTEAIVGVGDIIHTNETGKARITFFADGTDVTLEANTTYEIIEFEGDEEDFRLSVQVLVGQTRHRLNRVLGANSSYDVETPGMTLAAQGTAFRIRVEDNGRSAMLVSEGVVDATAEENLANVPPEFGIRSEVGAELSDVVRASTFDQLDSALDGCSVSVKTSDDVSLNVRLGPSIEQEQLGHISAEEIQTLMGVSETGNWYRIDFEDSFGWILSSTANVARGCAGLRVFTSSYSENGDVDPNPSLESIAEPTAEATSESGE